MKRVHSLLILFLSLSFLMVGCEKDKTKENIPSPKLEVIPTPKDSVPVGGKVVFAFRVENLATLKVNGKEIPFSTSTFNLTVEDIEKDTTFLFEGIGLNDEPISKSITIIAYTVTPPIVTHPKPVVKITASDTSAYYMDKVTISISSDSPFTVNGKVSAASFKVQLKKDSTFIVVATNANGTSADTVIVKVKKFSIYLCKPNYWQPDSLFVFENNVWNEWVGTDTCDKEDKITYKPKQYLNGNVTQQSLEFTTTCFGQLQTIIKYWELTETNEGTFLIEKDFPNSQYGYKIKIISLTETRLEILTGDGSDFNLFARHIYKAHY